MKGTTYVAFLLMSLSAAFLVQVQTAAQTKSAGRTYTAAEYDAYKAAEQEQDASKRARLIDDFISQYPKSALLIYVYPLCY
jgi:ABC-type sugar transport system substrate-binding protein